MLFAVALALTLLVTSAAYAEPASPPAPRVLIFGPTASSSAQLHARATAVETQIARLDRRLAADVEKYDQARAELDAVNVTLATARMQLEAAQSRLAAQQALVASRLSSMYKAGPFTLLDALLGSHDFADIEAQADLFRRIGEQDAAAEQSVAQLVASVAALEHDIDARRASALQVANRLDGQRMIVADELAQRQAVLANLNEQVKKMLAQQQASARSASEQLARSAGVDVGSIAGTPAQIAVVREAMRWLGVPYVWAGASPSQGFDCSGLVMYVYAKFGIRLPHAATLQARLGSPVSFHDLQPADLVFFGNPSFYHHVGIYIGDGLFIEAPHTGDVVKVSQLAGRGCALACRYDVRLP